MRGILVLLSFTICYLLLEVFGTMSGPGSDCAAVPGPSQMYNWLTNSVRGEQQIFYFAVRSQFSSISLPRVVTTQYIYLPGTVYSLPLSLHIISTLTSRTFRNLTLKSVTMADVADVVDLKGGHAPALKVSFSSLSRVGGAGRWDSCQVGGVRQVNKGPRKSESDKTETKPAKATPEDLEEFGEDKKEKSSTAIVSGAKTGNFIRPKSGIPLLIF